MNTGRMAEKLTQSAEDSATKGTTNGLSQLIARILAQLSLSAWLPAAALVLLTSIVIRMAARLDDFHAQVAAAQLQEKAPPDPPSLFTWVVDAVERLGSLDPTDLILMFVAVVVLTMLTQAFAFESIRLLEGYWSSWVVVEWLATARCWYFRQRLRLVRWRETRLIKCAWKRVEEGLREELRTGAQQEGWTLAMVDQLRAEVLLEPASVSVGPQEQALLDSYRWRENAPANLARRLRNIDKRLDDYPSARNVQPTRLGNVLRHFEEETGRESIEGLVDEVYDRLPFALQVSHDEQRGRLDLYCSMTFVWFFIVGLGVLLIGWGDAWRYSAALVIAGFAAALLTYRAAVASARYYGALLLLVAEYQAAPAEPRRKSWWRRLTWMADPATP